MEAKEAMETLAILLAVGLVAELLADVLRLPRMVVLLGAGVLIGPEVLGWVYTPLDSLGPQLLFSLGVALILFYGGLELSLRVLSRVGGTLSLLAVPGVVLTALVTGAAAALAFDLPFSHGFLIGAVVAPTDPAILIPLFERLRVRRKVVQTVVAESALNDPTGAILALTIAAFILEGDSSITGAALEFVGDLALSVVLGVALGFALAVAVSERRFGFWRESPALVAALAVTAGYVSIDSAGGSGYLGAFIAGLIAGNSEEFGLPARQAVRREIEYFAEFSAHVVVLLVFLVLGANLPLRTIADQAAPALAVIAVLLFLARPLTVLSCALPDRRAAWTREELTFVGWTRETGVVPASLAGLLIAEGVPAQDELVTVVALAVIVTLGLQSTTKGWLARRLRLVEEPSA
ncbi:MAG TPA: sodium:proton antiporter [Gaiellaceae bacterium]|nr:sodium:proton antiporter [Gaiellaceae bacterium]